MNPIGNTSVITPTKEDVTEYKSAEIDKSWLKQRDQMSQDIDI